MRVKVQRTIETRVIWHDEMFNIIVIKFLCNVLELMLNFTTNKVENMLQMRSRKEYATRVIRAISRLDVPTASDPIIQSKLKQLAGSVYTDGKAMYLPTTAAVNVLQQSATAASTVVSLISQVGVLFAVLRAQPDGVALSAFTAVRYLFPLLYSRGSMGVANRRKSV